jgi:hypothetical protein
MQLRFWRSRNWIERQASVSQSSPSASLAGKIPHPVVDAPSEAGFEFYFNAVTPLQQLTKPLSGPSTGQSGPSTASATSARGDSSAGGPIGGRGSTMPLRFREPEVESIHQPQLMNSKLSIQAPLPAYARPPRSSRRVSEQVQSLGIGSGLVIFGRSSTLVTIDPSSAAHLPTHENRVSRLSPRLSGVRYQNA